jgi:DNA helicase-2/ATP-dependent DNA helicase PcrA
MAIDKDEMLYEKKKLSNVLGWMENEILDIKLRNDNTKEKVSQLQKASKGSYSEELEIAKKLLEITQKNYNEYEEALEQPYFGRIDFREYKREKESYYIGKKGLMNKTKGDELVIDWRAPIADLYYSGTAGETYYKAPIGVISGNLELKRRFLIRNATLEDAFDDGINEIMLKGENDSENVLVDEFLRINLEESVSSKLKDVVATIQKEQNDIIRQSRNDTIIVQGAAGSGKTTVALHRLAYLLYRYKDKLKGEDMLVIAPNKLFLDYISDILPNLSVDKVKQKTFEALSLEILGIKSRIYDKDKKIASILESEDSEKVKYIAGSSKLKGSLTFKTMMDRYIKILEKRDGDVEPIMVEGYVLFDNDEIKRLYMKDMVNFPFNKRKDEIKRYLSLKIGEKVTNVLNKIDFKYSYTIARIKNTMEDGQERRQKLIELYDERDNEKKDIRKKSKEEFENYFIKWRGIETKELYYDLFNNKELFDEVTMGKIPGSLAQYIIEELNANREKNVIDSDDLSAMMYLKFKIEDISDKFKFEHIIIDEAQDYSKFQIVIAKMISKANSITMVGDIAQGIYYYKGIENWNEVSQDIFENKPLYMPLLQSYRSTVEIINVANKVLVSQDNGAQPTKAVLRHGLEPEFIDYRGVSKDFVERVDQIVDEVYVRGKKSVAIIGRTQKECKKIKEIVKKYSKFDWIYVKEGDSSLDLDKLIIPSYMTKGLEFDCSIIYDCSESIYPNDLISKRLLYVIVTRALHMEYIFYNEKLSPLLK